MNSATDVLYLSAPHTFQINRPQMFINLNIFLFEESKSSCVSKEHYCSRIISETAERDGEFLLNVNCLCNCKSFLLKYWYLKSDIFFFAYQLQLALLE